jgi:hypothetical protein
VHDSDKEGWILTKVLRFLGGDRYEVQDIEDEENGSPGAYVLLFDFRSYSMFSCSIFPASTRQIIPLPDPNDKDKDPKDPTNTFPAQSYSAGTEVMALYPDTTTFYHAKVVSTLGKKGGNYKVIFDDVSFQLSKGSLAEPESGQRFASKRCGRAHHSLA